MTDEQEKRPADKAEAKKKARKASPAKGNPARRVAGVASAEAEISDREDAPESEIDFTVICIGASAGGLDPLQTFFSNLGDLPCCAYVVITHLEASHPSLLPQLVQRHASLPVQQIEDGMPLEKEHVYIIPPDKHVTLLDGHFKLSSRPGDGWSVPINAFMTSLAETVGDKAVGIVLSGMGSDGTAGIASIKKHGGLVIAQEPGTTQFDSMPRSAMETGLVDYVLAPEDMPRQIVKYAKNRSKHPRAEPVALDRVTADALKMIMHLLRKSSGHDFSNYKVNTLLRRVQRRMSIHQLDDMAAYGRFLEENPKEGVILFKEMLIGVTNFFRDRAAWEVVEKSVMPSLFDEKPDGYKARVWVPGCATGEEAYTVAIVLHDYAASRHRNITMQVFATDINEAAIESARLGMYPAGIADDLSPDYLRDHFVKENSHYRVRRDIREMLIFAPQNVIKDPPFTKLDLICCRNLLIYMDAELQRKLLPLFHYSLRPGGMLLLGSSESIGEFGELFETVDSRWKIFRRRETAVHQPMVDFTIGDHGIQPVAKKSLKATMPALATFAARSLLDHFAPASVVATKDGTIVYIHGRTGRYIEPAPGHARLNVLEMAREGLKTRLPGMMHTALTQRKDVILEHLRIGATDDLVEATVTVKPLRDGGLEELVLIAFEELAPAKKRAAKTPRPNSTYVDELERELADTRENLQTTIEELETSNEEMRSINEEYQSTNEELQSANEELETSREEMQSLNEELATVNEELQEKLDIVMHMHEDLKVFLDSLDTPTIFLDSDLKIRRFTSQARRVVNIMEQDVGRPLSHLATHIGDVNLFEAGEAVNESLRPMERLVHTHSGQPYWMRVLPYRKGDGLVEGIVLHFVDIQELQRVVSGADDTILPRRLAEAILDTIHEPVVLMDDALRVILVNSAFCSMFSTTESAVLGKRLDELGDGAVGIKELQQRVEQAIANDARIEHLELNHEFSGVGPKRLVLNSRTVNDRGRDSRRILLIIHDR